jgi:hypothetical protein
MAESSKISQNKAKSPTRNPMENQMPEIIQKVKNDAYQAGDHATMTKVRQLSGSLSPSLSPSEPRDLWDVKIKAFWSGYEIASKKTNIAARLLREISRDARVPYASPAGMVLAHERKWMR